MRTRFFILILLGSLFMTVSPSQAIPPQRTTYDAYPPFTASTAPPLVMLVMQRDHKLYYEAYNDASDLNGDGELDITYKPDRIDYYGYFDSFKYYEYDSTNQRFNPVGATADKKVPVYFKYWSGDFLNYLTMSRMDTIRKVLYGGYRSTDTATDTVLERAYIPQDAHSWGKEYASVAINGYNIQDYTPFALPVPGTRHLFASTSLYAPTSSSYRPLLRYMLNNPHRIWEWVSKEGPVCDKSLELAASTDTWQIVTNSTSANISGVTQTVFWTPGYSSSPADNSEYDKLVQDYAIPANLSGSQSVSAINGSGNPFGADDNYLTLFNGTLNIPADGPYEFAVDGDDAVEFLVDINADGDFDDADEVVASWYGGHGSCGCSDHKGTVVLSAGNYTFQFRHQENSGSDNYYLRWHFVSPSSTIKDLVVRVKVGLAGMPETNCKEYPNGTYKPIGLLQKHGETNSMYFGLITGSYTKNTKGGVLRKNISSIKDEIVPNTGQISAVNGIVKTINRLRITEYQYSSYNYYPGWDGAWVTTRPMKDGEFPDWGNPIGEMMFEALRYFGGESTPTSAFRSSTMVKDDALGLPNVNWINPYTTFPYCAKPFILAISDIYPTYDSDDLPGSYFSGAGSQSVGTGGPLDVASLADMIYADEESSGDRFIGQQGTNVDGSCTAKAVDGFGEVRGLCPEEPTKQGSYYSASVAYYGRTNDLSAADSEQKPTTYAVALASPLPKIEIPLKGKVVRLVPFAKSVGGCLGISSAKGAFQPTDTIVDFYVEKIEPHFGRFRINYEDVEQAADHDMDAIAIYEYKLVDAAGTPVTAANIDEAVAVDISLTSEYASGCVIQHMGYIISGSTRDGTYLEIRDFDTGNGADLDYFLDTPNNVWADTGGTAWDDNKDLPLTHTRRFTVDATSTPAASLLENPLWYAAKWGGFSDRNGNNVPDEKEEWDKDDDGVPDTYFYVVNPLKLEEQLSKSFADILSKTSSGTSAAVVANNSEGEGNMIQAFFKPKFISPSGTEELSWVGYLNSFWVDSFGHLREDSNGNQKLDLTGGSPDKIIEYFIDSDGNTRVRRYTKHYHYDPANQYDKECVISDCTTSATIIPMEDVKPILKAGELLYDRSPADRSIFTFLDGNGRDDDGDGKIDQSGESEGLKKVGQVTWPLTDGFDDNTGEIIRFHSDNKSSIAPFLGLKDDAVFNYLGPDRDTRVENLIDFIRGSDSIDLIGHPNTRNRTFEGHVWKLGDIVHSTPVSVAAPMDNYDFIYGDSSYLDYYRQYKDRETVVYVGANDGMLHAFTHGRYTKSDGTDPSQYKAVDGDAIGSELWAYIPQTLLPHLKWLADPNYGHSFYVDLKPKMFDARIFDADSDHPGGWGTLLMVGLNMGGKRIWAEDDFDGDTATIERRDFYPTYILMDVTVPRKPRVLWERSYPDLGMSYSFPAVLQVGAELSTGGGKAIWSGGRWLATFGSGPNDDVGKSDYQGYSDHNGFIFVVDLLTGNLLRAFNTGIGNTVMNSPTCLDKGPADGSSTYSGLTYNVSGIYFGSAAYDAGSSSWSGNIYKINTRFSGETPSTDISQWSMVRLFDSPRPITGSVSLSVDGLQNAWIFFGTGRFMEDNDKVNSDQQYLFGLKDPYFNSQLSCYLDNNAASQPVLTMNDLFYSNPYKSYATTQTIVPLAGGLSRITSWDSLLDVVRNTENQGSNPDYYHGWYRELDAVLPVGSPSERVISKPSVLGGALFAPVYIPDNDICGYGGASDLYGLYYETGTPAWTHIFTGFSVETVDGNSEEKVKYRNQIIENTGPPSDLALNPRGKKFFLQTGSGSALELKINPPSQLENNIVFWQEK